MKTNYLSRLKKAKEINDKIRDLIEGLLIVGSMAYNAEEVSKDSDLDLVCVCDFSKIDFEELYSRLGQNFEPLPAKYAKEGKINVFSVVWDADDFEIGLHLWDKKAFMNVIELSKSNLIFKRENFSRDFKSTADTEILFDLNGDSKEFYKNPIKIQGGTILELFVFPEINGHHYVGIQVLNLLLNPKILFDKDNFISNNLLLFRNNLKKQIKEGETMYSGLIQKVKKKLPDSLKDKLINNLF